MNRLNNIGFPLVRLIPTFSDSTGEEPYPITSNLLFEEVGVTEAMLISGSCAAACRRAEMDRHFLQRKWEIDVYPKFWIQGAQTILPVSNRPYCSTFPAGPRLLARCSVDLKILTRELTHIMDQFDQSKHDLDMLVEKGRRSKLACLVSHSGYPRVPCITSSLSSI